MNPTNPILDVESCIGAFGTRWQAATWSDVGVKRRIFPFRGKGCFAQDAHNLSARVTDMVCDTREIAIRYL